MQFCVVFRTPPLGRRSRMQSTYLNPCLKGILITTNWWLLRKFFNNGFVCEYNFDPGYNCSKYGYLFGPCQRFDHIPHLETSNHKDIKISLFYKAGYGTQKDYSREEEIFNDTAFYCQEHEGIFFKK